MDKRTKLKRYKHTNNKRMQQNNGPSLKSTHQQSHSESLLSFVAFLQTQQKFIESELTNLLTHPALGLAHTKFTVKSLKARKPKHPKEEESGSWYDVRTKLQKRTQKIKDLPQNSLIVTSDLLIWSIPNLCSSYMGMMNYIKKWKAEELPNLSKEQIGQKSQQCKKLIAGKESEYLKFEGSQQILELELLKVPLTIVSDYFQKWLQINRYYELQEAHFKQKLIAIFEQSPQTQNSQQAILLKNLLSLAKLQQNQIENRVKQAQKYIQDMETVQSLDPEVYKNRLILTQYKPQVNPKNKYLQRFGKRLHFLQILKKRVAKAQKNLKQRKGALFQLIDMERNYIEILTGYIEGIKQPIEKLKILTEPQERLLFCNIEEIKKFHEELYQILLKRYEKHEKYTTYGDIIKGVIPFFKLYIDYIYQAQNAHSFIIKLIKENEKIREICDKYFIEKHKPASDELLQPTYKIARYEMLFDEIIKRSNPSTADYKLFIEAKQQFNSKLTEVNNTVDKIVRRNKLNQLEQEFATEDQPILILTEDDMREQGEKSDQPKSQKLQVIEYLNEFNVQLINQEKELNVTLFVFTYLILIVDENTRKKLYYIKADKKFYVRREDDSKVYRNIIKIHSKEGYVTITTGKEDKNVKKVEELFDTLKKVQKTTESKELVYVQVLGTEEIGSTSFAKYTEYIVEIKFLALKKLLHLRFSEISNIVKVMQHEYKNSLGITEDQTLKKTWFNNHKSKTIENRKRVIEQILQKLFNHNLIKEDPKKLLTYLNLSENFFLIAKTVVSENIQWSIQSKLRTFQKISSPIKSSKIIAQQASIEHTIEHRKQQKSVTMSKISESSTFKGLRVPEMVSNSLIRTETYLSKKQLKQAFTLLCATEIKLGRDIYHDVDQKVQIEKGEAEKVEIYIHTTPHNEVKMVRVTKYDTVEDVCNKVSKLLGLRENRDFRLFHEIGKKELRVLQHQQLILKIFSFPKSKRQSTNGNVSSVIDNVSSSFQSMASSIIKVLSPETHPTLIFKKYYFLPFEIESRECRKDLTRLRLLTYQVFAEVKEMKYQLNFEDYLDMAALLIYIEMDGNVQMEAVEPEIVSRIIPDTIFKLKNYSEQEWLKKIQPKLLRYVEELKKVIHQNELQMKNRQIKNDSPQKTALYFGHRHLASQIVLNKIKSNPIYGSNLFYVQPYKTIYEEFKTQGLKMSYNMWLAVKVDSISLLTPSSKQLQFSLKCTDIDKINVYSEAIVFKTDDYTNKEYRFNTYQSFEISQLVKYYKTLNEIMRELKEDEKLSNEVKKYRNEIEKYRSTYERQEEAEVTGEINFGKY